MNSTVVVNPNITCDFPSTTWDVLNMESCALPLRPKWGFTFGNFRTNNKVARARATVMRYENGARPFGNHTLVILGPCGSGKTHLLNAAGHAALKNDEYRSTITLAANQLQRLVEDALYFGDWKRWEDRLLNADWLAIDDVNFVSHFPTVAALVLDVLNARSQGPRRTLLSVGPQVNEPSDCPLNVYLHEQTAVRLIERYAT